MSKSVRNERSAVTWEVRVAAAWTWRLLLIGFGIYVLIRLFGRIELVAFSFVIALFFTAVLHPLERVLRRVPGTRSVSAGLALLIGLLVLAGVAYFVVSQITAHAAELGNQISQVSTEIEHWLKTGPLHLKSSDIDNLFSNITDSIRQNQGKVVSSVVNTVRSVIEGLGALLIILLSTFFLLRDGDVIWRWVLRLMPRTTHVKVDRAGRVGWHSFGGYMRGQVLIALFHGVSVSILLLVLRVPLAAALGVLIFLGAFIPIIGLTVAGAFAVAVTLLEHGLTPAIVVAIAIVILVQLETHLLQPVIMSRSVQVHPLAVALAVLTGTVLAGIVGALLAVPLVAFLNATIHSLRSSSLDEVNAATDADPAREPSGDPSGGSADDGTDGTRSRRAGADGSAVAVAEADGAASPVRPNGRSNGHGAGRSERHPNGLGDRHGDRHGAGRSEQLVSDDEDEMLAVAQSDDPTQSDDLSRD